MISEELQVEVGEWLAEKLEPLGLAFGLILVDSKDLKVVSDMSSEGLLEAVQDVSKCLEMLIAESTESTPKTEEPK